MINTIFWFADNIDQYNHELTTQGISDKTIVFIKDSGEIYVNNKKYGNTIQDILNNPEIVNIFNNDSVLKQQVQEMIDALERKYDSDIESINNTLDYASRRTLVALEGSEINSEGTPSVTVTKDTANNREILTFNYLKGLKGDPGAPGGNGKTPYIQNGYWYIDGVNTQVKATGRDGNDGKTPYIQNGYWYVDGENTGVKAKGEDGESRTIAIDLANTWTKYSTEKTQTKPAENTFTLTVPPSLQPLDWLWSLTQITYEDGTVIKTYNVSRVGDDGPQGIPGEDGWSTHFAYAELRDGVDIPSDGKITTSDVVAWSLTNFPGANAIGTYRDRSDHDSTNIEDYTWSKFVGPKGDPGKDGTGINIKGAVNSVSELSTINTSELKAGDAYMVGENLYVWTGEQWRNVGRIKGDPGNPGQDATLYYLHIAWANSADGSQDFSVTPIAGVEYEYMGTCIDTNVSDPNDYSVYTWVKIGKTGPEGPGITTVTEYYLASSQSTGITNENSAFTTYVLQATKENPYLWNYEEMFFSNGASHKSNARIIARYIENKGIDRIEDYYMLTTNNQVPAKTNSSWSTTVPIMTTTNRYLWNYEIIYYTDETSDSTDVRCIGVYGDTGNGSDAHDYSGDIADIWEDINKKGEALGEIVTTNENGEVTGITDYLATKINDTIAGTYSEYDSSTDSNVALSTLFAKIDQNKDDVAKLSTIVTNNSSLASASSKLDAFEGEIATKADINGVKSWLSAVSEDPDTGVVTAASITAAVNNSDSLVTINADKINFDGYAIFTNDNIDDYLEDAYDLSTVISTANQAAVDATNALKGVQTIYKSGVDDSSEHKPLDWVTNDTGNQNVWTTVRPKYNSSYPYLFKAVLTKDGNGIIKCTTPKLDNTTTVIDGSHITTGTISADRLDITNIFAKANDIDSHVTISADKIDLLGHVWGEEITANTIIGKINNYNGQTELKIDADHVDISGISVDASNVTGIDTLVSNTIASTNVVAGNLVVNAANIQGTLTTSQIDTNSLVAKNVRTTNSNNTVTNSINSDGSGMIASGGIQWTTTGGLTLSQTFLASLFQALGAGASLGLSYKGITESIYDDTADYGDAATNATVIKKRSYIYTPNINKGEVFPTIHYCPITDPTYSVPVTSKADAVDWYLSAMYANKLNFINGILSTKDKVDKYTHLTRAEMIADTNSNTNIAEHIYKETSILESDSVLLNKVLEFMGSEFPGQSGFLGYLDNVTWTITAMTSTSPYKCKLNYNASVGSWAVVNVIEISAGASYTTYQDKFMVVKCTESGVWKIYKNDQFANAELYTTGSLVHENSMMDRYFFEKYNPWS